MDEPGGDRLRQRQRAGLTTGGALVLMAAVAQVVARSTYVALSYLGFAAMVVWLAFVGSPAFARRRAAKRARRGGWANRPLPLPAVVALGPVFIAVGWYFGYDQWAVAGGAFVALGLFGLLVEPPAS